MNSIPQILRNIDIALIRRYHVHRPDDEAYTVRKRATLRGAIRAARRTRGTRIFVPWRWSHIAVVGTWSERRNGYIEPPSDYLT